MKKIISISLFFIIIFTFVACNKSNESDQNIQMVNPVVNVTSVEDFIDIGIYLNAPKSAENVEYFIIDNSIAQVEFMLEEREYTLRGSKTIHSSDLHGVYEQFDDTLAATHIDGDNYNFDVDVQTIQGGKGAIASAQLNLNGEDTLNITLYTPQQIDAENMSSIAVSISNDIFEHYLASEESTDGQTNGETQIESTITWNSDDVYAAALIGGYYDTMEEVMETPKEMYVPNVEYSDIYDGGGNEKYLIVPRYTDIYIEIFKTELTQEGEVEKTSEEPAHITKEGAVLWLSCNMSDLYSDVLLEFKKGDTTVAQLQPYVSLKDGTVILSEHGQLLN